MANSPSPTIVCLCGSTRHKHLFLAAAAHEALSGRIVLMPGVFSKADGVTLSDSQLHELGELHHRKIELAHEVLVIDTADGLGEATTEEIQLATDLGKRVRYWSEIAPPGFASSPIDPVDALVESHQAQRLMTSRTPTLNVPAEVKELRCALIEEEAAEFRAALGADDLVEVADAVADLLYVVYGAALTFGIPVREVFAEVHRSNMTKLDSDGRPIYRADGKVMKGPNFSPPDLQPILDEAHARADSSWPAGASQRRVVKVYIAADFARANAAEEVAAMCRSAGAEVVSTWHSAIDPTEAASATGIGGPARDTALLAARRNIRHIEAADLFLLLTTGELSRGGRHFETGYAFARGKRVLVVGGAEHAFHHLAPMLIEPTPESAVRRVCAGP